MLNLYQAHLLFEYLKTNIIPTLEHYPKGKNFVYANEADMLNLALFGKTASDWRKENPDLKGNIRDYATLEQLVVLFNLESFNAELIKVLTGQGAEIDTTTASGKRVFGIFATLAEFERELISERTKTGLETARARGREGEPDGELREHGKRVLAV